MLIAIVPCEDVAYMAATVPDRAEQAVTTASPVLIHLLDMLLTITMATSVE